jgi:hypothetical protein
MLDNKSISSSYREFAIAAPSTGEIDGEVKRIVAALDGYK